MAKKTEIRGRFEWSKCCAKCEWDAPDGYPMDIEDDICPDCGNDLEVRSGQFCYTVTTSTCFLIPERIQVTGFIRGDNFLTHTEKP